MRRPVLGIAEHVLQALERRQRIGGLVAQQRPEALDHVAEALARLAHLVPVLGRDRHPALAQQPARRPPQAVPGQLGRAERRVGVGDDELAGAVEHRPVALAVEARPAAPPRAWRRSAWSCATNGTRSAASESAAGSGRDPSARSSSSTSRSRTGPVSWPSQRSSPASHRRRSSGSTPRATLSRERARRMATRKSCRNSSSRSPRTPDSLATTTSMSRPISARIAPSADVAGSSTTSKADGSRPGVRPAASLAVSYGSVGRPAPSRSPSVAGERGELVVVAAHRQRPDGRRSVRRATGHEVASCQITGDDHSGDRLLLGTEAAEEAFPARRALDLGEQRPATRQLRHASPGGARRPGRRAGGGRSKRVARSRPGPPAAAEAAARHHRVPRRGCRRRAGGARARAPIRPGRGGRRTCRSRCGGPAWSRRTAGRPTPAALRAPRRPCHPACRSRGGSQRVSQRVSS